MKEDDIGKLVVVVISEDRGQTQTAKGRIVHVIDDNRFEIEDKWGNLSRWNELHVKGIKFLGGDA